jgi:hypothetical protein
LLMVDQTRAAAIRRLNDDTRRNYRNARFMMTRGLIALNHIHREADEAFRTFDDFNADNDPFGEHDCFAFTVQGYRLIAKCDCYAPDMAHYSRDPTNSDPNICVRVWTLMLEEDY